MRGLSVIQSLGTVNDHAHDHGYETNMRKGMKFIQTARCEDETGSGRRGPWSRELICRVSLFSLCSVRLRGGYTLELVLPLQFDATTGSSYGVYI